MRVAPIKVGRIYLDPENPRHDPIGDQSEIIAHLPAHEDVRAIARSIARLGSTSPIELLALVEHPTARRAYLTAEGNRRICALKLLADPDKAPTEKDKRYLYRLSSVADHRSSGSRRGVQIAVSLTTYDSLGVAHRTWPPSLDSGQHRQVCQL
ncbi:MAG TPA: hypothetical protein VIM63_11370 [Rhodoferax sp.]